MFRTLCVPKVFGLAAAILVAGPAYAADAFSLWVTETPSGGSIQRASKFAGGIRSYVFDGGGYGAANVTIGATINASGLSDPTSVLADNNGNLFIANMHFYAAPATVSRVTFAGKVPNAPSTVLATDAIGVWQTGLTASGGLIVSNDENGARLYPALSSPATVSYNSGSTRGVVVNGNLLYATFPHDFVQTFNVSTGALLSTLTIPGAQSLHYGTLFGNNLWLADATSDAVFKISLDAAGIPIASSKVASVDGAISVAFSPAGDELIVAGYNDGFLTGFAVGANGDVAAIPNLHIDGGTLASWNGYHVQFLGMAITSAVPEPGTVAMLLVGLLAIGGLSKQRKAACDPAT